MNIETQACFKCECAEELTQIERSGETEFACIYCRDAYLKKCCACGEYVSFEEDDYAHDRNGDLYCQSCRDDQLSYCEKCDEYSDSENFVHIADSDEYWCEECADSYAYRCEHCGDWVSENYGDNNTIVCNPCYADHYSTCDDCGEVFQSGNLHYRDGGTYCGYCIENHSSNVHEYSYEPYLNFLSSGKDNENRLAYLGFELEAGGVSSLERNRIADEISDGEDTFYLKEDGSIPEYGFELVSHPITLKRHKELDWGNIFRLMSSAGMKSHDLGEESCGLHVHVSRNYLSPYKWLLIDWFISKYQEQFEVIARRKETHWARFKKSNGQPVKEVYGKSSGTRYQAVNFENTNTVEFRLFRGTLKYSTFMATLEIVDALVHWANQLSISDILSTGDAFENFTGYIQSNPLYENAVNYLKENNLMEVKKCA